MKVNIFNCEGYKPFSIRESYTALCNEHFPSKDLQCLSLKGTFIAPKDWLAKQKIDYELADLYPNNNSGLVFGKVGRDENTIDLIRFKRAILKLFLQWQRDFCKWIYQHLSSRIVNGEKVILMTHLQQLIAQLLENFNLLDVLLTQSDESLHSAANLCRINGNLLMKLPGGRAFLAENVLELVLIYEGFYNVYFYC